ncbi:tetratricopeptide repeat protein [Primorskyibacter aestuariivivens]|uniref:class I SAM-dependent DNA methyltransferase n=1 Tax=Primorskyibacter aestuariivivens TaxID=1888912 RepID=UPI002300F3F1|nr:tetratricopeptide repeat protein [Primorskyibacter aestuariivivens]MDA7427585.1 tetratricopeptide repeat protein [Primorskyibacter aestuariivivens]
MVGTPFPSGDLSADRRAAYAETMAHLGELSAAIEVLSGALKIAPGWAAGWFRLGEYFEGAGAPDQAAEAWRRAIEADPSDPFGAGLKRDLLLKVPVAERMPAAFVELLFDQYAPRFDNALVNKLAYRGPELLTRALAESGFAHAPRVLDLGCGTGLMGVALREACDWLEGYDISGRMLDEAAAKGIYDLLEKRDLGTLEPVRAVFDLIVAADVFIYLGALEQIIGWCAGALALKGHVAFTLEWADRPVELRESRRFAHSPDYVADLLGQAGFPQIRMRDCILRQDRGADIRGFCVVASGHRCGVAPERDGDAAVLA